MKTIRIGSGAGYSGDRIEPAVELAESGDIQYLVFECLAERTIAIAQQAKLKDPAKGYDPLLADRMHAVLRLCHDKGIRIITNMGAANPAAGAARVREIARSLGLRNLKIAAVSGDDVLETLKAGDHRIEETGAPVASMANTLVSANAYLGAAPIVEALRNGADVVITGRVADPALFLAPQIHAFGWAMDDWDRLGKGTVVGHLLECAGQITGGYFADPGVKDVAALARLGFPIAEVSEDGSAVITKVEGSGGAVTTATCKEQLLYEIHDPSTYLTPDVVADFSHVTFEQVGTDRVRVSGGTGRARPETLKVSVGYIDSYIGEGQISYAGPGAVERGRLALAIVRERLALTAVQTTELRFDLIGVDSIHGDRVAAAAPEPYEVRVRVTGRADSLKEAVRVGNEVETLYTNGPASGGGATKSAREVVAMLSALLPRTLAKPAVEFLEA
ncbi:acyclic terpene utilization AtuA family protein [Azospirillum halopraeferens]|uniref:acyclic terpene utilization AtuA family protein n=1 Tax=Azospirillum halopraeferens TaxID=34010 RepID=UPI00040D38D7|nr:acyclic terpene utilization AtuA family protein [Azospirillum halopraeferens]